ncbi:RHS repeat-associated core domain-containing protein [Paraburkholderia hayleyella]|uniref:RHS repeat-associated core domain-containing protein n=1 Tax=Paraburkholderia hayleyella TaxID=2152889 RepID=UPI001290AAC9|nr:RHS repeat-associated core domain-containing protein [Paraburkholderia hayleyella]
MVTNRSVNRPGLDGGSYNGPRQVTTRDSAGRLAHQVLQGIREHPAGKLMERRYRYDAAGQLEQVGDMRRGTSRYAYDPLGRLTWAQSSLGVETFAFDPASNLLERDARDEHDMSLSRPKSRPALLDNLLKDYAGTHYDYDERGNLRKRVAHGEKTVFGWNSFNRMVSATTRQMEATYVYDALGRRIAKSSEAQVPWNLNAGSGWREAERKRLNREFGYGLTLYGWDGDLLAYETSWEKRTTTHYVYEPESFTPLMQATGAAVPEATASAPPVFDSVAYYHCDQIGTPQELSDANGTIAWSAYYRAWGEAQEVIGDAARKAGISNPLRFAGQYFDHETGLHYNRHRYYDPHTGQFISRDPIGLVGGVNVYQYAPNPIGWIDPLGLIKVFRGAKPGNEPSFEPRSGEYKVKDGMVQPTHGVSVFDNPASCSCRGFEPHEINSDTVPDTLQIIQRGKDQAHYEITPSAPITENAYKDALGKIKTR